MATGWVAVWIPNGLISAQEMAEFGKPAIEAAYGQEATSVTFAIGERLITMNRLVLILPVFIESPDWREAQDFQNSLEERADRTLPN